MVAHYRQFHPDEKDAKTNIQIMTKLFDMTKSDKYTLKKVDGINGTYRAVVLFASQPPNRYALGLLVEPAI